MAFLERLRCRIRSAYEQYAAKNSYWYPFAKQTDKQESHTNHFGNFHPIVSQVRVSMPSSSFCKQILA
jgi:hypothetical protein